MGKLEDMERRISSVEKDVYDLKYGYRPLRPKSITVYFSDGPLKGEERQVAESQDYRVPLIPYETATNLRESTPLRSAPYLVAVYRAWAPLGPNRWEYRVRGYECSGGH